MKKISLVFIIVAAMGISSAALAGKVSISGTHSESEIMGACAKAKGGVPFTNDNGTYGCQADGGSIKCTNGKCEGSCSNCGPAAVKGRGGPVLGVLSGTTLKAGATPVAKNTTPPQTPARTKMQEEPKDPGGMHNGENEHGGRRK